MTTAIGTHLAGFILTSGAPWRFGLEPTESGLLSKSTDRLTGWPSYIYETKMPIPEVDIVEPPPYRHEIILRGGRTSLLALAANFKIIKHLIEKDVSLLSAGVVRQNEIRVHSLVSQMMAIDISVNGAVANAPIDPDLVLNTTRVRDFFYEEYTLGYVGARTDAFGEDLRNIQFYGDRVSRAALFHSSSSLLRFYNCRLRRGGVDIIKLGRDGFVSFALPMQAEGRRQRLREVNSILRELADQGLLV